ncbi:MAG: phosphoribosylglycinamide formyltransferase [Gammaproteobacteria bacterium]|nr:phosphoribosylglycinamide formyltransferase [Gammaproteobacteria bacterium]
MSTPSIVILISGSGSNLQAIIDAVAEKKIHAEISAVISNRPDALGLIKAKTAGINTIVIDHTKFTDRQQFDEALARQVAELEPALVVLAGFMRILPASFIDQYEDRLLNIHPSLLPAFKGMHTHRRALEAGHSEHGASVHFVSNELDSGPVVIQAKVPVLKDDSEKALAARVLKQEHIIYPLAIEWFVSGRLSLINNKVHFDNKPVEEVATWQSNILCLPQ